MGGLSLTSGLAFNNQNQWVVLGGSNTSVVRNSVNGAGDTTEETLASLTMPANTLGPNGYLKITTLWSMTGGASTKTLRIRLDGTGGAAYLNASSTTNVSIQTETIIRNAGSVSSQVGSTSASTQPWGGSTGVITTSSKDTTTALSIVIASLWGAPAASENITLRTWLIEAMYRP